MQPIKPVLADNLADLDRRLRALEFGRQPYIGDWYELPISQYIYNGTPGVMDTTADQISRFAIGDKIWTTTSGNEAYYYVTQIDRVNNQVHFYAGTTYTLGGQPDVVRVSKLQSPVGFPSRFFAPVNAGALNTMTASNVSSAIIFHMSGRLIFMIGNVSGITLGGVASNTFKLVYPTELPSTGESNLQFVNTCDNVGTPIFIELQTTAELHMIVAKQDGTNFALGSTTAYVAIQYISNYS